MFGPMYASTFELMIVKRTRCTALRPRAVTQQLEQVRESHRLQVRFIPLMPKSETDWMMLSAASLVDESPGVRDAMILQVHRYLSANTTNLVFPVEYDIATGNPVLAVNR